jgi:DNA-binding NarL/FixJ family response regulator
MALTSEGLQGGVDKKVSILEQVHATKSRIRCVRLVKNMHPEIILDAFQGGANGALSRTEPTRVLFRCVSAVHRGQIWVSSEQLELIVAAFVRRPSIPIVISKARSCRPKQKKKSLASSVKGLTHREVAEKGSDCASIL